ncbi:hypothetical protein LAZ67_3004231 [Cordylochernes scorpioides]|uniref:Uncharacterized protein n=1 Tax=Cordylochernes scorpioides TaxID=51811 RepID=A0ABY6K952_9ARAC|nr:hypothetical protein LAZ67_3004231 [Cordylochernes scorpioides]
MSKYPPTNQRGGGVKKVRGAGPELVSQLCQVDKKKASRRLAQDDLRELRPSSINDHTSGLRRDWVADISKKDTRKFVEDDELCFQGWGLGQADLTTERNCFWLPKVELPKFKGNLEDWLSWWGQFSKINDDETLGDVDKFHYLLQAVVEGSRAQRLVCSYPITEDNYPKVIQALRDRFGDKNLLIEHYIRRLLKLVVSNARKENLPLDEIYDDLMAHLMNLESLGVNTEMAGVFLYPLVESSLPLDIIQVWQRNPAVGYGIKEEGAENGDKSDASGRLQALMDFLRDEVKGAERMAFAKENFEGNSSMRATGFQLKTPRKTPPTVSNLFGSTFKRKCIFCQRNNHLSRLPESRHQQANGYALYRDCFPLRFPLRKLLKWPLGIKKKPLTIKTRSGREVRKPIRFAPDLCQVDKKKASRRLAQDDLQELRPSSINDHTSGLRRDWVADISKKGEAETNR